MANPVGRKMAQPFWFDDALDTVENTRCCVKRVLRLAGQNFVFKLLAKFFPGGVTDALVSSGAQVILPLTRGFHRLCLVGFFARLSNALAGFGVGVAQIPVGAVI